MDDRTLVVKQPAATSEAHREESALLVLTKRGLIVATAMAGARPVSVGRSSSCALRCQDPTFPRHAGEVILKPVPLFRHASGSMSENRVSAFNGSNHIDLRGFRLALLTEGEMLRSGGIRQIGKRTVIPRYGALPVVPALFAIAALLASSGDYGGQKASSTEISTTVPFVLKQPPQPVSATLTDRPYDSKTPTDRPYDSKTPMSPSTMPPPTEADSARTGPRNGPIAPPVPHTGDFRGKINAKTSTEAGRVDDAVLDNLLAQAAVCLERDDPQAAGRLMSALKDLLDGDQSARAVDVLEPYAMAVFRRAYLSLPYNRELAEKMLGDLAEAALPHLPSCEKARAVLKRRKGDRSDGFPPAMRSQL